MTKETKPPVTPEEIKAFYVANPRLIRNPETMVEAHRRGEHIGRWLSCDLCMASITPTPPPPSETRDLALLRIYGTFRRNVLKAYHKGDWEAVSIALGAFNTSCDTLPPLDEPKVIQSSAPPSETKLSDAIDAFDMAIRNDWIDSDVSRSDVRAARSSLESLYRELLLERDEARDCAREYENERNNLSKDYATLLRESNRFEAELSALRPLQLTEDERQFITDGLLLHAPGWRIPEALSEKLRISSKATSEEL